MTMTIHLARYTLTDRFLIPTHHLTGQPVGRKLHAVKSSPQLLQSAANIGSNSNAPRAPAATGHNTAPRHRRLSCSSSEGEDEDPTFRRLERSKQEEDSVVEGKRRDSIAAQICRGKYPCPSSAVTGSTLQYTVAVTGFYF